MKKNSVDSFFLNNPSVKNKEDIFRRKFFSKRRIQYVKQVMLHVVCNKRVLEFQN